MRYAGIDPGATTGLVIVDVPSLRDGPFTPPQCVLVYAASFTATSSKKLTHAERDMTLYAQLLTQLSAHWPHIAVIEEPADIGTTWRGGKSRQGRTSTFALGKTYGLAVAACSQTLSIRHTHSYLCKGFDEKPAATFVRGDGKRITRRAHIPRAGWMPRQMGNPRAVMAHADQERFHRMRIEQMQDHRHNSHQQLTEHEVFAAAVLMYHLHHHPDL